jgi:chloride channel protein, CIC family
MISRKSIKYKATRIYLRIALELRTKLRQLKMTEHLFMMLAASLIGILAGFGAVGIKALIHYISDLSFSGDGSLLENIASAPMYLKILIPALGGLIVGPLIYFFAPEAKGHGVPEVMQSVLTKGGIIRPRVAFVKAIASSITIGTGGSVGKEGPIIQIGSTIGSTIGQLLNVPTSRLKVLVGCGAAAGIAGAFNAPVAGALFAIEIILMDFAVASFSPIVIASVVATVISHAFEGDFAAFSVSHFEFVSAWEVLFYIILGGLSGLVSFLFIKILYFFEDFWDDRIKIKPYLKAMFGGLIIGIIAIFFPEVMGVGYDAIDAAINGRELVYHGLGSDVLLAIGGLDFITHSAWIMAILLVFVKIFASSMTLGSGGSGGVFAPSLFIGAMLGAGYGWLVHLIFPEITAGTGAYALVAMGGMVAGTTRAPITAILIVFELTKENAIILPLMLTCIGAVILSSKFSRESIYTLKLIQRNINIRDRAETNIMKSISVADVFRRDIKIIPEDMKFADCVRVLISERMPFVSVNAKNGDFKGMISLNDIKDQLFDKDELHHLLIAGDLASDSVSKVKLEDNCHRALKILNKNGGDLLPVMDADNPKKQIGILWRRDIDDAYHKEIERVEMTSDFASKILISNSSEDVQFMESYSVSEIPLPKNFIGKTLAGLQVRKKFGVDVLSIKKNSSDKKFNKKASITAIPDANHRFEEHDVLIIAGETENINKFKSLT